MKLVIFGCGRIANRIAKSCKLVKTIELAGFASKDLNKAKEYADLYECKEYGDYDHFLDSDVDAVYIATHNPSHLELIRKCLEAHKNVICEKPMLFTIQELEECFALARKNDVVLMEALKSVFLPSIRRVKQMMNDQDFGTIEEIYASFCRAGHHSADHWINDPLTGGAIRDLGSYCVGTANFLMGKRPKLISIESDRGEFADTWGRLELDYDGVKGKVAVSNSFDEDTELYVKGSRGFIRIENFWKNGQGHYEIDGISYEFNEELLSDFYYELEHFAYLSDHHLKESEVMSEQASKDIVYITGGSQ